MENITPPYLKPGDTVGIIAPARFVSHEDVNPAIRFLTARGFIVKTAPSLFAKHFQFAGSDSERASDFMEMVNDSNVKAILCARGGYGTVRILDRINLRKLQLKPKWIVGYSDITVLHSIITSWFGIETLHATMPVNFPKNINDSESASSMVDVLMGRNPAYSIPHHPLNRKGTATGFLTGGNLSILASLIGTDADTSTQERILFIEDVDEYLYHVDRMMLQLKRAGKLKSIAGLVVGHFSEMKDNNIPFGLDAYQIISEAVKEYRIPVCFGFPAGHQDPNLPLIMGRKVQLVVNSQGASLTFHESSSQAILDTHGE